MEQRTKEQILEKHRKHLLTVTDFNAILNAMDEYASLRCSPLVEALELFLTNIDRWLDTGIPATSQESKTIYETAKQALSQYNEGRPEYSKTENGHVTKRPVVAEKHQHLITDKDYQPIYLRSECEQQRERMIKLGINVDDQFYEQSVNAVLMMAEKDQYIEGVVQEPWIPLKDRPFPTLSKDQKYLILFDDGTISMNPDHELPFAIATHILLIPKPPASLSTGEEEASWEQAYHKLFSLYQPLREKMDEIYRHDQIKE